MAVKAHSSRLLDWVRRHRFLIDGMLLVLLISLGLRGWWQSGHIASPRLEMVPELAIVRMAKARLLEGGPLAEWVPLEFGGFPYVRFLSYPFYDLMALTSIATGIAVDAVFKAAFILAFVLSGLAFYAYAREMTDSRLAGLAGGLIYGLFPFHLHGASEAWVHALFWVITPLVFMGYERVRQRDKRTPAQAMAFGAIVGLMPLINTEHTILIAPFFGVYLLVREAGALGQGKHWGAFIRFWLLASLVAIGLAAFFVIPGIIEMEYVGIHLKHGGESFQSIEMLRDYAVAPSLVWRAMVKRIGLDYPTDNLPVIGRAFWSVAWYPGVIALGLAVLGIWFARREPRLRLSAGLLALACLFVLGRWLPWNPFTHLPYLGRLASFRGTIFVAFFLATCAAWGAQALTTLKVIQTFRLETAYLRSALALGLLVAIMLDYWPATKALTSLPSYFPEDEVRAYQWLAQQEPDEPDKASSYRSWEYMSAHRDAYLRSYALRYDQGLHSWGYYDNGAPRHMWALYSWGDIPTALYLSSTRYILTRPNKVYEQADVALLRRLTSNDYSKKVWDSEHLTLWENPDYPSLARVYDHSALYLGDPEYRALDILPALVGQGVALVSGPSDYADDYDKQVIDGFDHVIVREPWVRDSAAQKGIQQMLGERLIAHATVLTAPQPWGTAAGPSPALLSWRRPGPEAIEVEIHMDRPGILMVSEAWYPNWHAYVDGQETTVWRVNYAFLGVQLGPGQHTVRFRYEKPWYAWLGYGLTVLTLASLAVVAWRRIKSQ